MTQYAIPLAGMPPHVHTALTLLLEAPGLEHDTRTGDTYIELVAHYPSPGQRILWDVALGLSGFGDEALDLYGLMTRVDRESRQAAVAAIVAASEGAA